MNRRAFLLPAVATALVLVATAGGSSPAAHPDRRSSATDLLASAHPTGAMPTAAERAYDDRVWIRGSDVSADTAALTSTTCDGCVGESTTLQVVYANRARRARLDNVANAWAQACSGCTGTALSVQVVVLRGRPTVVPNNRALSVTAACDSCRTSALAFQVVLVADDAAPMSDEELAGLQAWFDQQAAVVRASVSGPLPTEQPTATPTPTATGDPTPTGPASTGRPPKGGTTDPIKPDRLMRRDATSALAELEALLTTALDADPVSADVEVGR